MKSLAMEVDDTLNQEEHLVPLKVYIPDLLLQKNLQFHREDLIWDIKEQIIDSLPKELKERFNYGIFCPPINGKAGKFLDEYRPLGDYPFPDAPGYVELRYKRRVYKIMNLEEKQIKQMHTRANLRRMLDYVTNCHVEKITKLCSRGMDPNFHCPETGETPLTTATCVKNPAKVIMSLINGGALLDFRTKDGHTALHRAVQRNNLEALKTLLDLGASPNYKDSRGLTPLYYTLLHSSDPRLTEMLLHDHAIIGTCDPQGWQEVHQACKHGLVQHLEHLLFYGADMNARNASGNTPLHVCAVNDQESCARVLLFRGSEKNALNFANQSPYQVAVIAGNLALADIIKNHSEDDVVPYREPPRYNPRRGASVAPVPALSRTTSDPRLELGVTGMKMMMMMKPPSPCPSNCSLPPFSSVSCISEASSTGSSATTTTCTSHGEDTDGSFITEKSLTSDSSGVCTSHSGASYEEKRPGGRDFDGIEQDGLISPGDICVCMQDYCIAIPGYLRLNIGDSIEVIGDSEEEGFLEGRCADGVEGLFPVSVVRVVNPKISKQRVEGRRELNARKINPIPRRWQLYGEPRTVVLHKGKRGFGFVLRGAKATSPLMERQPSEFWPGLQYLDDVDRSGVADQAGLKKGDFLLEINGQDVSQTSHEHVVSIIRHSGDIVAMTVVTVQGQFPMETSTMQRQCATLPRKFMGKKAPAPPKRDPRTTLTIGGVRARSMVGGLAEIEALEREHYDSEGRSTKSSSVESIPNKHAVSGVDAISQKIASIRSRPGSQRISASELERFFARQGSSRRPRGYSTLSERKPGAGQPKVYGSVAAMRRSRASGTKIAEIVTSLHKEFHSTPDLQNEVTDIDAEEPCDTYKKSQSQEDVLNAKNSRHSWACVSNSYGGSLEILDTGDLDDAYYRENWKSIEDVYHGGTIPTIKTDDPRGIYAKTLPLKRSEKRVSCPPPSHPPPPPPLGQMIKVDVSKTLSDYANVNVMPDELDPNVMSSFRPGDSAKLYASPEVVSSVGYKTDPLPMRKAAGQPRRTGGGSSLRSQSVPPKMPVGPAINRSTTSSETENSGDSSALYSTFKKPSRQRDSLSSDSGHVSDRGTLKSIKGKQSVTSNYASKFDVEDSDTGSPQTYPVRAPGHEPFIPEPDYETSEEEELLTSTDKTLTTFGKGEETALPLPPLPPPPPPCEEDAETPTEDPQSPSPHAEAKRAIQEARERLRFSNKPADKNATVVFISGKITDRKVEKSEIQLHRTEEGRLTGTVVISTSNEPKEPVYMTSPVEDTSDSKENLPVSRYPRRDAPASEYAKYRQQILSGLSRNIESLQTMEEEDNKEQEIEEEQEVVLTESKPQEKIAEDSIEVIHEPKPPELLPPPPQTKAQGPKIEACLRIALTASQKQPPPCFSSNENIPETMKTLTPRLIKDDDGGDNSSSGVSSDIESQSELVTTVSSSTEEESKADTIVQNLPIRTKPPPPMQEMKVQREIEQPRLPPPIIAPPKIEAPKVREMPSVKFREEPMVKFKEEPMVKFKDEPMVKYKEEPTVKFREEPVVKFREEHVVKFREEPVVKFREEPVVKFREEPMVKFREEPVVKFREEPMVKFKEEPMVKFKEEPLVKFKDEPQYEERRVVDLQKAIASELRERNEIKKLSSGERIRPTSHAGHVKSTHPKHHSAAKESAHHERIVRSSQGTRSSASVADRTLEESLEVLRLQVNSLGLNEVNEVDVFTQLVPPPPEFAAAPESSGHRKRTSAPLVYESATLPIAPPPEFSDVFTSKERRHTTGGRLLAAPHSAPHPHRSSSSSSASKSGHRLPSNPVDLALLASLCAKSGTEFCRVGKRTDRCTVQPSRTMASRGASGHMQPIKTVQKEFRFKLLQNWTPTDIADWLDSLFLSEYKHRFAEAGITGAKLANMDSNDLMGLGVKQMGHRLNMERSLKRYLR